jgi:tetratricopeptide (TPR) repeat protein
MPFVNQYHLYRDLVNSQSFCLIPKYLNCKGIEAVADYTKAIDLMKKHQNIDESYAPYERGWCYHQIGEYEKALADIDEIMNKDRNRLPDQNGDMPTTADKDDVFRLREKIMSELLKK